MLDTDKVYKVNQGGFNVYSKKAEFDFWFDKDYYTKESRLKVSEKELKRRENIKKENEKWK